MNDSLCLLWYRVCPVNPADTKQQHCVTAVIMKQTISLKWFQDPLINSLGAPVIQEHLAVPAILDPHQYQGIPEHIRRTFFTFSSHLIQLDSLIWLLQHLPSLLSLLSLPFRGQTGRLGLGDLGVLQVPWGLLSRANHHDPKQINTQTNKHTYTP